MNSNKISAFLTEVFQQPKALKDLIAFYRDEGKYCLEKWEQLSKKAGRILFSGMGTSAFVPAMILAKLARNGIDAATIDAGELLHYPRPIKGLLVLISQSGESIETRKLAESVKTFANLVAITNNEKSSIARAVNLNLPMCAGHETAISTKTYVNTLAVLFLMSQTEGIGQSLEQLEQLADLVSEYDSDGIAQAAKLLSDAKTIHFISRGPAMVAAKQAALTFMEGTRISAAAFTGGGFRHGPFELVDGSQRCVFFIPGGRTFELLKSMVQEVANKGSHVIIITDQDLTISKSTCCVLKIPDFGEELFCLSAATTQELLLDAVAGERGLIAGEFRYGGKITTHE